MSVKNHPIYRNFYALQSIGVYNIQFTGHLHICKLNICKLNSKFTKFAQNCTFRFDANTLYAIECEIEKLLK